MVLRKLPAVGLALAIVPCFAADQASVPVEGDPAPDFKLTGTDDREYTLSDFRGKSAVVLVWYPMALTPD